MAKGRKLRKPRDYSEMRTLKPRKTHGEKDQSRSYRARRAAEKKKMGKINKFYCFKCQTIVLSKSDTATCRCGLEVNKIMRPASIGKLIKLDIYEEKILNGTPYRSIDEFRKTDDAANCEDLKRKMMRKYGDLAISDSVRLNEGIANRIADSISRFTDKKLSEDEKNEIQQLEGTVKSANIRRDTYDIDWSESARSAAGKYNTDKYDFFDLDGDWNSWDLNRVITERDIGSVGRVESKRSGVGEVSTG